MIDIMFCKVICGCMKLLVLMLDIFFCYDLGVLYEWSYRLQWVVVCVREFDGYQLLLYFRLEFNYM